MRKKRSAEEYSAHRITFRIFTPKQQFQLFSSQNKNKNKALGDVSEVKSACCSSRMTQVPFPAHIWWLTAVCSKGSGLQATNTHMCRPTHTFFKFIYSPFICFIPTTDSPRSIHIFFKRIWPVSFLSRTIYQVLPNIKINKYFDLEIAFSDSIIYVIYLLYYILYVHVIYYNINIILREHRF